MTSDQIKAIQQHSYTVTVFLPNTGQTRTVAFNSDYRAVWFMERAVHQGLIVLKCTPPC